MNLLRELKCAHELQPDLPRLVLQRSAALGDGHEQRRGASTKMDDTIGVLDAGPGSPTSRSSPATASHDYRAVIDAEPADVALVMRGGKVLYGDDARSVTALASGVRRRSTCAARPSRSACMSEVGKTYAQLQTAAGADLPGVLLRRAPTNEPIVHADAADVGRTARRSTPASRPPTTPTATASPTRPTTARTCSTRSGPMDNGVQADADGDGMGDACDPCPLDAEHDDLHDGRPRRPRSTTACRTTIDNCPDVANADQPDTRRRRQGRRLRRVPDAPRTRAPRRCPETIYDDQERHGADRHGRRVTERAGHRRRRATASSCRSSWATRATPAPTTRACSCSPARLAARSRMPRAARASRSTARSTCSPARSSSTR